MDLGKYGEIDNDREELEEDDVEIVLLAAGMRKVAGCRQPGSMQNS